MSRYWLPCAVVALLCGCGATPSRPHSSSPSLASTLDIHFRDNVAWPYRVERLLILLDGAVLYQRSSPSFPQTISIGHLADLPTGDHTLEVLVQLRYPTGTLGTSCILEAVRAKHFTAEDRPIDMVVDVYASGVTESFSERVRLAIWMSGDGAPLDYETSSYDRADPCT